MVLACRALYDVARVYRTPFVSGKDSLNNEYQTDAGTIVIPHTLLVSSFCVIEDVRKAVTMDLKAEGNDLFILGETLDELGGSHWLLVRGEEGGAVPLVRPETALGTFAAVEEAIAAGFVRACHDLSEGGLAVALAESAFAGDLGVQVELGSVPRSAGLDRDEVLLFSESQSRFIVETEPRHRPEVERLFSRTAAARIGRVTAGGRIVIHGLAGQPIIDETTEDLRDAFRAPLGA
jgi:phosphoribosylformylglycinamidine synthase